MQDLVEDGLHGAMVMTKDDTNKVSRYDVASTRPVSPDEQRFSRCGRFWKVTDSSEETSARYASQGAVAKATKVAASIYGAAKPKLGNPRAPATKKPLKPLPAWNDGFGRSTSSAPVKPRPGLAAHRANVRTGSNKAAERAPIVRTENIPKEAPEKSKYGDVEMRDADDDADEASLRVALIPAGRAPVLAETGRGLRPRVAVDEAYLHCAKAIRRSKLWDEDSKHDRKELPSLGKMILEQTAPPEEPPSEGFVAEVDELIEDNYKNELY